MANVLIVDDDADTVNLETDLLESAGYVIQTGGNGAEGLRSLEKGRLPDCIVLDVDMPVLSGPGMAHEMLLHDAGQDKIPIVLVSGRDDVAQVAARMGTKYFLKKATPGYAKNLLETVACALAERQTPVAA